MPVWLQNKSEPVEFQGSLSQVSFFSSTSETKNDFLFFETYKIKSPTPNKSFLYIFTSVFIYFWTMES